MKGIKLFVVLTLIGIVFILYRSSFSKSLSHLLNFDLPLLAAIAGLVFLDWVAGGLRIYIFAAKVHPGISLAACVRANVANIFMGGVTPSQTGGGAGQIYILFKEGMGGMDATVASFLGFISTAIFFPICGILVITLVQPDFQSVTLRHLSSYTIVLFSLILGAVILSLLSPTLFERVVRGLLGIIPVVRKKFRGSSSFEKLMDTFRRYHELMTYFLKERPYYLIAGFLITAIVFFNKFIIAFLVVRGLGIDASFWNVIYLQLIIFLVIYFAPTPGASGVSEVSTAFIMGQIIPKDQIGVFVILWRFFVLFIGMIVGGYVLTRCMLRSGNGEERHR